jgi:hypothetical protein
MMRAFLLFGLLATGCSTPRVTGCPTPASSQLFVVTSAGDLFAFDAGAEGATMPLRTVGTGFTGPIAVDTTSHELFALRGTTIEVYDSIAGATTPLRTLTGLPAAPIIGLVVDPPRRALFVLTKTNVSTVSEDGNGNVTPIPQIGGPVAAVALDPLNEEVIVATGTEIDVYARDRLSSSAPTRVLRSVPTGYGDSLDAFGLAVDTQRDELYAAVELPGGVNVSQFEIFDGTAQGAAPSKIGINLDLTGAMAVDCARGEAFVGIQNTSGPPIVSVIRADGSLQESRELQLPANPAGVALGP